jgi:hypothetical protein
VKDFPGRDILFVSVHLENRTDEQGRCEQLRAVADLADKKYPDLPVVIAGDMNTFTYEDGDDEVISDLIRNDGDKGRFRRENPGEWETLFDFMEGRGYDFRNCNQKNKISCRDHIEGLDFLLEMNLDWFFTRGINASEPSTVATIFNSEDLPGFEGLENSNGTEMTDHNILSIYME